MKILLLQRLYLADRGTGVNPQAASAADLHATDLNLKHATDFGQATDLNLKHATDLNQATDCC